METSLCLNYVSGLCKSDELSIIRGGFQGGSLSTFLFCISAIALSNNLNRTGHGYKIYGKVMDHLFFTDDLKLYARNNRKLEYLLKTKVNLSNVLTMTYECALA